MEHGNAIRLAVERIRRLVRWRRGAYYGLRGLVWGLTLAVLPVALRMLLPGRAWAIAVIVAAGSLLLGFLYGVALRVPRAEAARVADRAFGLHDRLGTALELLASPRPAPLEAAVVEDAGVIARSLLPGRAVPWRWPREARFLPVPVVALAILPHLPPLPVPEVHMPAITPAAEEEKKSDRAGAPQAMERPTAKKEEGAERVQTPEQKDYAVQRPNPDREQAKGDLSAAFKDTKVASKRPDFNSFLKQGDDRIRLLERVEALPDLQKDFTQNPYKVVFRKSRSLLAGVDPRQLSPEKLRELLQEMNRLGRRPGSSGNGGEGDWGQDMAEGREALDKGQMSRALDAMERALDKMRAMDDRERGGKGLEGGRNRESRNREGWGGRPGEDEGDFGEGQGSLPGKGTNPGWRGDPSSRLGQSPLDIGVEGQMRRGQKEAYDTNLLGKGVQNASRLPSLSVVAQYRKLMEEALAKEPIPLDYRNQVKTYFQSLEER